MAKKEKTVELKPRVDKISKAHLTDLQKSRFAMRQRQILIAKKMGKKHIFQKEFR